MSDEQDTDRGRAALVAAVLVALDRVDLSRREQILILSGALEALSVQEQVDEEALTQLVNNS